MPVDLSGLAALWPRNSLSPLVATFAKEGKTNSCSLQARLARICLPRRLALRGEGREHRCSWVFMFVDLQNKRSTFHVAAHATCARFLRRARPRAYAWPTRPPSSPRVGRQPVACPPRGAHPCGGRSARGHLLRHGSRRCESKRVWSGDALSSEGRPRPFPSPAAVVELLASRRRVPMAARSLFSSLSLPVLLAEA
jgi:hypothetical protein